MTDVRALTEAYHRAVRHHQAGEYAEAERIYRELLEQRPGNPEILYLLGTLLHATGRHREGLEQLAEAIRTMPDNPSFHYHIALIHAELGNAPRALEHYRKAVDLDPDFAEAHCNLGKLCYEVGENDAAYTHFERALALRPRSADCYHNLAITQLRFGQKDEAADNFRQALKLNPDFTDAQVGLGLVCIAREDLSGALDHYRRALEISPASTDAQNNLAIALSMTGRHEEAVALYEKVLQSDPDNTAFHSNLLFTLSYNVMRPPREMLAAHQAWDRMHGAEGRAHAFRHAPPAGAKKRLRIGYVSPNFHRHAVSYFFEPILTAHDHNLVEVYCYAEVPAPDEVTGRLRQLADGWRPTAGMSDAEVARRIFDDGIDVLVDLAGHTAGSRLRVFTYKPAPVQATYLGYFTTTGLQAMDYWITDDVLHPGDTPELAVETLYRLPRCSLCYQPPAEAPEVAPRPAGAPLTFGAFNKLSKISPRAVALWSRVLQALPDARLLIKSKQIADDELRKDLYARFADHGIEAARLELRGHTADYRGHLATYHEVDIALDTVPRTGGSTTADALWMGVPVLSLAGGRYIERLSATMLAAAGLGALITDTEDAFVERACELAGDPARRAALREGLRPRLADSPLCDGAGLARALEDAYFDMWQRYSKHPDTTRDRHDR